MNRTERSRAGVGARRWASTAVLPALLLGVTDTRALTPARDGQSSNERVASVDLRSVQVTGVVQYEGSAAPVGGAPVVLVASGRVVARGLTDAAGRFTLQTQVAGPYEVRAELIGHPVVTVEAAEGGTVELRVPRQSLDLGALAAAARGRACVVDPPVDAEVSALWREARKALEVESWVRAENLFSYDVFQYERQLGRENRIHREEGRRIEDLVGSPARSRPPEQVSRSGYAQSTPRGDILYAPDADVLLSESFTTGHCFGVRAERGRVGIAFEPVAAQERVDIAGVVWLDSRTAELREIEFRYTGLGRQGAGAPGGGLEYKRLSGGYWTLSRWWIRTPVPREQDMAREEGVEVVRAIQLDGTPIPVVRRAALVGTLTNRKGGDPVAGASIRLVGTNYLATTNEDGRFYIPELPEGRFQLAVGPDAVERAPVRDVWLVSNQATHIEVALDEAPNAAAPPPARHTALDSVRFYLNAVGLRTEGRVDSLIRAGMTNSDIGTLVGRVTDVTSGRPITGVLVRVVGTPQTALTESDGRFSVGDVRAGQLVLEAQMLGYATRTDTIHVTAGQIVEAEFAMTTRPIELDPITVTVRSRWLDANGFFERRNGGLAGHFFSRADIERRAPNVFTELLREIPGVAMVSDEVGKMEVRFRRITTMTGNFTDLSRGCQPAVFYDGVPMNLGFDRLHEIPLPFIDGVEVYVGAATPIQFKHPCGAILIWTRRPR